MQTSDSETAVVQPTVNLVPSTLHTHALRATLQLLGWLLLHPSAWRAYATRVVPQVPSNFALSDLTLRHVRSAEVRRLLQLVYGLYPLLTMVITALLLLFLQQPLVAVGVGTVCGTVAGWLGGLLVGATISVPAGLASVVAGIVAGVMAGVGVGPDDYFAFDRSGILTTGSGAAKRLLGSVTLAEMLGWTTLGIIGSVAATTAPPPEQPLFTASSWAAAGRFFRQRIAPLIVGGVVGSAAVALLLLARGSGALWTGEWARMDPWLEPIGAGVLGLLFALTIWRRTERPLRGIVWGASIALFLGVLALLLAQTTDVTLLRGTWSVPNGSALRSLDGALLGLRVALIAGTSLGLLYGLGRRLGGEWCGAVASALGSSGAFAVLHHAAFAQDTVALATFNLATPAFSVGSLPPMHALIWAAVSACVGLSYPLWLPVLFYPLELVWNAFLFQIDKRRSVTSRPFLPAHSVYWDEHQRLPLPRLDAYLVLAVERNPWGGFHALDRAWATHQQRSARRAQLELDARWMADAQDVDAILRTANGVDPARLPAAVRSTIARLQAVAQQLAHAQDEPSFYPKRTQLYAAEEALDTLLHEMVQQPPPPVSRLRPVVARWRQLVWEHDRALAASIEVRKALDSPYVVGLPLPMQHDLFVGRTALATELAAAVRQSQMPVFLHGARLMGKTSFLNNSGRLMPNDVVPLVVDLQGLITQSSNGPEFLWALARSMVNAARRQRGRTLTPFSREDQGDAPFAAFEQWLDGVEVELDDTTVLLALDAYEVLDDAVAMGRFDADETMGVIWRVVQARPQFRLLLAGTRPLSQMEHWSRYVAPVQTWTLGHLTAREVRQLIEQPMPDFALRYEPDAVQKIVALTGGHPALTQLFGHVIVALKNEGLPSRRGLATSQDVAHAVPLSLKIGEFFFGELTRTVGERGLEIARTLALRGPNATITHQELAKQFALYLDETLLHLQRSGIIESLPDNELAYGFSVELMRRWFVELRGNEKEA